MGKKIVSIVMTAFMLIMCVMTMTTLSMTNMKNNQDHILERAGSSVLSTNGEIKSDSSVTVRGSSLISSILEITRIDNKITGNGNKIYKYLTADGKTYQSRYTFNFEGMTDESDIVASIDEQAEYNIEYTFNSGGTVSVNIKKGS